MKKHASILILALALVAVPLAARAATLDSLWRQLLNIQAAIVRLFSRPLPGFSAATTTPKDGEGIVCTQDAFQCPNGSWVGRTGPKCEFKCPTATSSAKVTPPFNDVSFACDGGKRIDAKVEVRPKALGRVQLKLSDRPQALVIDQTRSGSGARYATKDESFVFWNKGDTAFIEEHGTTTFANCVLKPSAAVNCPQFAPPSPNFCPDGKIVAGGKDASGCQLPPRCERATGTPSATSGGQVFCTMEAKQCPDGSWVGRSGPKCEFRPCPGVK